jgi:signal transduction histidine kinase
VAAAVLATIATVWVTAGADFLAHAGWLAVQKADLILGPVLVGLYWRRRRPASRFGPILIAVGFVGALYALHSSSNPWLYGGGLVWENVVGLAAYVLILTFPTGRLDGLAPKLILIFAIVGAVVPAIVILLLLPQVGAGGSISGCRELCPENALAIASDPALALDLWELFRWVVIAVALATIALLIHRLLTGTPPQRRAIAIGTSVAVLFLLFQLAFHLIALVAPDATRLSNVIVWGLAITRAGIWYGFLAALIAAQLFAARALHRLVRQSLRRPSRRELEEMLREPLGDPRLRVALWDARSARWTSADPEESFELPDPGSGLALTVVEQHGRPAAAIVHDEQLDDDPELLDAAGAVLLLAAENAELDEAWNAALGELRESRVRLIRAGDNERRKLERNLHDGVQQRLVAIGIELALASDVAATDEPMRARLMRIGDSLEQALDELREVAHGLHPPVLSDWGLVAALERLQPRAGASLVIDGLGVGRHAPELESAVYYCCLEAIQNAAKHSGAGVNVRVTLREVADELRFEVSDDGAGFDPAQPHGGTGLQNMRDRVGALDGRVSISAQRGRGTIVSGAIPLRHARAEPPPSVDRAALDDEGGLQEGSMSSG